MSHTTLYPKGLSVVVGTNSQTCTIGNKFGMVYCFFFVLQRAAIRTSFAITSQFYEQAIKFFLEQMHTCEVRQAGEFSALHLL